MAKGIRRLDGTEVRLLVAAILCAGFFIASTGTDDWCSECYPHAGNDLTIVNNIDHETRVILAGPVEWTLSIAASSTKTIRTRVGLYRYYIGYWENGWDYESMHQIFVTPDSKNIITIGKP